MDVNQKTPFIVISKHDQKCEDENELSLVKQRKYIIIETNEEGQQYAKDIETKMDGQAPSNYMKISEESVENEQIIAKEIAESLTEEISQLDTKVSSQTQPSDDGPTAELQEKEQNSNNDKPAESDMKPPPIPTTRNSTTLSYNLEKSVSIHPLDLPVLKNTCYVCGKEIYAAYIFVSGKMLHNSCFVCEECKDTLTNQPMFRNEDKFFCEDCYHKKFSVRCSKCSEPCSSGYIEALGKTWHEHCFVCFVCSQGFPDGVFQVQDREPYCTQCWISKFS